MKLIRCRKCNDVVRLIETKWRVCECKRSGGQYNKDLMTATVGGDCDIVGISNLFFDDAYRKMDDKEKTKYKKKIKHHPCEIWYGEGLGDLQIHRIKNPSGPRLKMKVEWVDETHTKSTFIDKRKYVVNIKGNKRPKFVIVENEMRPSFRKGAVKKLRKKIKKMFPFTAYDIYGISR